MKTREEIVKNLYIAMGMEFVMTGERFQTTVNFTANGNIRILDDTILEEDTTKYTKHRQSIELELAQFDDQNDMRGQTFPTISETMSRVMDEVTT